jgi:hypothetical protein
MQAGGAINSLAAGAAIKGLAAGAVRVADVVRDAAARTGTDFSYMMAQAKLESGLNPDARATTSSARGLYQFTDGTWLATVRKHGAEHGLGWAAEALQSGAASAGSAARDTILSLRNNAQAAALMAGEFARDNAAVLEARLGRAAGAADLYMAHFLGAGGAVQFLGALERTPDVAAASLLPKAAAANRSVFYAADGAARSVAEVYARFSAKLESAGSAPLAPAKAMRDAPTEAAAWSGRALPVAGSNLPLEARLGEARLAYMLLAELGA